MDEQDHKEIYFCLMNGLLPENIFSPNELIMKKSDQIRILEDRLIRNKRGLHKLIQ